MLPLLVENKNYYRQMTSVDVQLIVPFLDAISSIDVFPVDPIPIDHLFSTISNSTAAKSVSDEYNINRYFPARNLFAYC